MYKYLNSLQTINTILYTATGLKCIYARESECFINIEIPSYHISLKFYKFYHIIFIIGIIIVKILHIYIYT